MRIGCRGVHRTLLLTTLALLATATRSAAQSETTEYYGIDAVGSVRIVFNASGTVVGRQDYDPFGREILSAWGVSPERFGGQTADGEVQQAYFHARQFQSRTGRFGTVDPVFDVGADPQRLNRYSYALGNPLKYADVFGEDPSNGFNPCVDSSSPDCLSEDPFLPGFGGGNDEACPITTYFHGGLCGEPPQKPAHPPTKPTPPTNPPPTNPPPTNPPPVPPAPPKPTSWYDHIKNLFGRVFGDQLQNTTDRTLCVKPESGEIPFPLAPGEVYRGAFDGFSDPANPGLVFKTVDFMSVTVLPSGAVIPYPGPLTNVAGPAIPAGLAAKQYRSGGWKSFNDFKRTDGWDPTIAVSYGGC